MLQRQLLNILQLISIRQTGKGSSLRCLTLKFQLKVIYFLPLTLTCVGFIVLFTKELFKKIVFEQI